MSVGVFSLCEKMFLGKRGAEERDDEEREGERGGQSVKAPYGDSDRRRCGIVFFLNSIEFFSSF